MPELPYSYFVSYAHQHGFGCLRICTDSPVDRMDHVIEFRRTIERITRTHGIVVLWWKLLPGDEPTASGEMDAEGVADAARDPLGRRHVCCTGCLGMGPCEDDLCRSDDEDDADSDDSEEKSWQES